MNNKINIKSKIRVTYKDLPENNTMVNKNLIKNEIAKKYGVDKNNITINFVASLPDNQGNLIEIKGANIDNILDLNYQHQLFKTWIERENIQVDFDDLLRLDQEVEEEMKGVFESSTFKNWELKWVKINNFLSYGKGNTLDLTQNKGLNIVTSSPKNFGGKTTMSVDSIFFLFLGKTTKTSKNEEIFNRFTNENELIVKGLISFNSENIIIERKLTRKEKKNGGWNVTSVLKYYKILSDGTEELMNEEDSTKTTAEIKKLVGNEETFNLTIMATGENLMDLVSATPTENGKLLNKLIGLEVVEHKEAVARKKYNLFKSSKISNTHNPVVLTDEINEMKDINDILKNTLSGHNETLNSLVEQNKILNETKDNLLLQVRKVDINVNQLDEGVITKDLLTIEGEGKHKKIRLDGMVSEIDKLKDAKYDEVKYSEAYKLDLELHSKLQNTVNEINKLKTDLETTQNSEICPTCNQKRKDVDVTKLVSDLKERIISLEKKHDDLVDKIADNASVLESMVKDKKDYDERVKLEIERDRLELDIKNVRLKYKERKADLDAFNKNKDDIKFNNENNLKIEDTKTKIVVNENSQKEIQFKINEINNKLSYNIEKISTNEDLLVKIKEEALKDRLYSIYIDMVGKKGITKLVIRSILPIINSELQRIMDETTEFVLEVDIDDKNEIEYNIINGEVTGSIKSGSGYEKTIASLALRCVLSKVSHLPMPNFIVFDEVLGKVSPENYPLVEIFFNKIKEMFDSVLLIAQDDRLHNWGDNIIHVEKVNNISKIS